MANSDLEALIAKWLDGRLGAEDSLVLQATLRDSAEARLAFRQYAQIDAALHQIADTSGLLVPGQQPAGAAPPSPGPAGGTRSAEATGGVDQRPQVALQSPQSRREGPVAFGRLTSWCMALAVGVLLAVSVFSFLRDDDRQLGTSGQPGPVAQPGISPAASSVAVATAARKPPAPVATLARADGARWKEAHLSVGQALYEGETISLEKGAARISIGFGAEIVADAPFSLTFLASDRIALHHGELAVDVAPWGTGFTVATEEMDVVDLGTTFTVSASPGSSSETTVLKGVVRVRPATGENEPRRGLLITEGQRLSIDGSGKFENVPQENVQQLLGRLNFGHAEPYRPVVLKNTGLGLSVGDEDLHWRVVVGPEPSFRRPEYASVCGPERGYLPNNPDVSQWVSIAAWRTAAANSIYTFQTEFDLDGYDLSTMQLFGRFLADNGIAGVRVNGQPVEVQSWIDNVKYQPFGDPQFRFVNVTEGLVDGRNVIEVDVHNGMMRKGSVENPPLQAIPNPMALRVEWYAFGRQQSATDVAENTQILRRLRDYSSPLLTQLMAIE